MYIPNKRHYAATRVAAKALRESRQSGEDFVPAFLIADVARQYHMSPSLLASYLNERRQYKKESYANN